MIALAIVGALITAMVVAGMILLVPTRAVEERPDGASEPDERETDRRAVTA